MRRTIAAALAAALAAGCSGTGNDAARAQATFNIDAPGVAARLPEEALGGALWLHPQDATRNLLVGAAGAGGLVLRGLDGRELPGESRIQADHVALAYGFDTGLGGGTLVVANDRGNARLWLFGIDPAQPALRTVHAEPLPVNTEVTGLCLYRSPASARYYAFVTDDDGMLQQWELVAAQGGARGVPVRKVALGKGIAACAVDDARQVVYVADEAVGIWRVAAEPESDPGERTLVDRTGEGGHAGGEVKGLAVHGNALLAMLDEGRALNVYTLPEGRFAGALAPTATGEGDGIGELEAVWAGGLGADAQLVLPDAEGPTGPRWRIVPWSNVAAHIDLPPAPDADPRTPAPAAARIVQPSAETRPVDDYGDAADDVAIWVHPQDPARSLLIAAQKKRGIEVYDLEGRRLQLLADGRMNNVDLRQGVMLGNRRIDIIAGSNRTHQSISLYTIDASGRLSDIAAAPVPTGMRDPYGLCMYVSARDGAAYVFVNNSDRGEFGQWKLSDQQGRVAATLVRRFVVGSQAEGCVADDETGALYIAEEDAGLWRYSAEPDGADTRMRIDATGEGGNLTADVEGLAIYHQPGGAGYLVLSNQGANDYAVYRRDGANAFIGRFAIGANDALGIDGASETDGLEVTSQPLGPAYPHGLLVVQDGRNITPSERQNFKLVPWERVAEALGLD